jgi:general secretion pathway protein N
MTPFRTTYTVALLTLVGLSVSFGVDRASSQDLNARNDLVTDTGSRQQSLAVVETEVPSTSLPGSPQLPIGDGARPQAIASPQGIEGPNPLWALPIGSLAATRERPIFSPSRRPAPPLPLPVPQAQQSVRGNEPDRPLLILVGTVAGATDGIAVFQNENSKDIVRLRTGESHSGWTLAAVKPREVTLLHDRKIAILAIPSPPAN